MTFLCFIFHALNFPTNPLEKILKAEIGAVRSQVLQNQYNQHMFEKVSGIIITKKLMVDRDFNLKLEGSCDRVMLEYKDKKQKSP